MLSLTNYLQAEEIDIRKDKRQSKRMWIKIK